MKKALLQIVESLEIASVEIAATKALLSLSIENFDIEFEKAKIISREMMLPSLKHLREAVDALPDDA